MKKTTSSLSYYNPEGKHEITFESQSRGKFGKKKKQVKTRLQLEGGNDDR